MRKILVFMLFLLSFAPFDAQAQKEDWRYECLKGKSSNFTRAPSETQQAVFKACGLKSHHLSAYVPFDSVSSMMNLYKAAVAIEGLDRALDNYNRK